MGVSFRLITANLLHEHCDVADFAHVLESTRPDVLLAQELGPDTARVVADVFPVHHLRPAPHFTGRGFASRFDATLTPFPVPGRPGTAAVLDIEGTEVAVAGIHLLNPIDYPWWVTARTRRRQIDGLFSWLDTYAHLPAVVGGDFNASPAWPAYKRTAQRLTDLVEEWAQDRGVDMERTWSWRPGWPRMLRIDHVFGSGVRATGIEVRQIKGSDHAAIVADIELVT